MEESTTPDVSVKQAFETINNYIAEDLARAHSRFAEGLTAHPTEIHERSFRYLVEYYDIHGHHYVLLVTDYDRAREWFGQLLEGLMDSVMTKANELTSGWHYPLNREIFLKTLRSYLIGRCSHWKSEGLKRAREMSAVMPSEVLAGNPVAESKLTDAAEPGSTDIEEEKGRREHLLADYLAAIGNPSRYRIYTARNSGIHKPEFYKWLNGALPRDSETAKNFERFLREKKAPIPRKNKA